MTETVLKQIVRRAVSDAAFRGQLRSDPAKALAGITLTAEERSALSSGDPTQLTALGVDQRMSKAFSAGLFSEASKLVIGDTELSNSGALTDEPTAGERSAIVGDPAVAAAAAFESPFGTAADYHLRMTESTIDSSTVVEPTYTSAATRAILTTEGTIDTSSAVEPSFTSTATRQILTTEGTIDAGSSAFEQPTVDATTRLIQTAEGNIDTGAVVDPSVDAPTEVQISSDVHVTEF
jgi:hypothetical protein